MKDILLVFTSMTGNTEEIADCIIEGIVDAGRTVEKKDVFDADADDLSAYQAILLGSYTWGDGDLPDEFLDFYDDLVEADLTGKKAAVFGSCDSFYPNYGGAVDRLVKELTNRGANVILDGLKIDLTPTSEERENCKQFGANFVQLLMENNGIRKTG